MSSTRQTKLFVIAVLSAAFVFVRFASAAEEHEHKEGKAEIPATIAGIWQEVKEHEEKLGNLITDKKFDKVHEVAFEIRDMVNALPDKSVDLPADNLAKVKSNAKYVTDIAKRLDESGDAGDQAVTEANFKKLQGILKSIEAQYPPEELKKDNKENKTMPTMYICPMHPEVQSDKPGNCPKCGMKLEPAKSWNTENKILINIMNNKWMESAFL